MKRRFFLKFSAALTYVGMSGGAGAALAGAAGPSPVLPSLDAMRRIGRRYLELRPDERDAARGLRDRLGLAYGMDRDRLRGLVGAEIRADLARHDVVTIDGWVVPRALARVCSAVALA